MKTGILPKSLTPFSFLFFIGTSILCSQHALAQQANGYAYAVTDDSLGGLHWNVLRTIDPKDGSAITKIGKAPAPAPAVKQAKTHAGKVAACAFDRTTGRLFFATMQTNELYAVNINSNNTAPVKVGSLGIADPFVSHPEENNISRMVIGADGKGYALSNDAEHFFVFNTTGNPVAVTDRGSLKDAPTNGENSIHSFCTGWGGDMIADKDGDLYLVNIYNRLFKIDVKKQEATYIGAIQGLPNGFYTNGMAVDNDGKIILGCSSYSKGYFHLDLGSLKATPIATKHTVYNASDLASANLLFEDKDDKAVAIRPGAEDADGNRNITVWPNPVPMNVRTFNVVFNALDKGDYLIQLVDLQGKVLVNKPVRLGSKRQTIAVEYDAGVSAGLYMVKVINSLNSTMQTAKKIFIL